MLSTVSGTVATHFLLPSLRKKDYYNLWKIDWVGSLQTDQLFFDTGWWGWGHVIYKYKKTKKTTYTTLRLKASSGREGNFFLQEQWQEARKNKKKKASSKEEKKPPSPYLSPTATLNGVVCQLVPSTTCPSGKVTRINSGVRSERQKKRSKQKMIMMSGMKQGNIDQAEETSSL